jgi:hypothetical protein
MLTCEHCRDRLLDYVYGLLEGGDLQETREHLHACAECQAALQRVQAQQKLMACAAKAVAEVAEFTLPLNQPASAPPTLAMTPASAPKRPIWRRAWVAWTAAAALLIAVSASFSYYRHTLHTYQHVLAQKQQEHKQVVEQFTAVPAKYKALQNAAIADLRASAGPYLHVLGPTTLQPGAKAHLHITSHHAEGTVRQVKSEFVRSNLRIKVVDSRTGKAVQPDLRLKCDDDGQALAELDARNAPPNCTLSVIVEAETGSRRARIQETVQMLAPTFVTRIDTNKIAYQIKDVLFFRVLVLDRYSLRPPSRPVLLRVELQKPDGKPARWMEMPTGEGGVLASEFAIDDKFIDGNYTLNVRPVDPAETNVQAASQRLEVVRELRVPDFQFDKDHYLPGDQLSGIYRGGQPLPNEAKIGEAPVPLTVEPLVAAPSVISGSGVPGAKGPIDPKKESSAPNLVGQRFSAMIPRDLPAGASKVPFTMPVQEGKKKREILRTDIPLGPTDFTIDFFPEGGDLIAGVPNRAFYRVRSKSGEPVTGKGQVMLLTGKNDIVDSSYQLGMGYLDFIPNAKETYTVRITTPAKIENVPAPFTKLGIRPEGVVIQVADFGEERVPKAVGSQGDPIRLTIRQQGPARKLLLLAQCRGQIVDQRWVEIKAEPVDVTLQPTQEARGMIRVTAYQLEENALQPVAERLVYRGATQRLDLGFALNTQQLQPGPVFARVSARDEKGQPVPAWLLASVIDERFQNLPRSLSAHFFLLNEIRTGPDLDNAQLILHDSPESTQVLERFLGTHGWRRFIRSDEPALNVQGDAKRAAQPLIFSRENMPQGALQKQYEDNVAQVLMPIRTQGFVEAHELEIERDQAAHAVALAVTNLRDFEERAQGWVGLAPGILLALLLGTSLILMGVGTYRIVRNYKLATPAFGGSFACLAACLVILFAGPWIGPFSLTAPPSLARAHGPPGEEVRRDLEVVFEQMPAVSNAAEKPLIGVFSARALKQETEDQAHASAAQLADELLAKKAAQALSRRSAQAFARRELGDGVRTDQLRENDNFAKGSPAWNLRHGIGKKADEKGSSLSPIPVDVVEPKVQPAPPKATREKPANKARDGVQYFHQHVPNWQSDTLLWHPTLWLGDGSADVRFDFASGNATYRVLLLGHSPTGRFGFYERRLDVLGR